MPQFETIAEALEYVKDHEETLTVGQRMELAYNQGPSSWNQGQTIFIYPTAKRANPVITIYNQVYGSGAKKVKPPCFEPTRIR